MIVLPPFRPIRIKSFKEDKVKVVTGITQYVVFEIRIPGSCRRVHLELPSSFWGKDHAGKGVIDTYSERYLPEEIYGIELESYVSGEDCKPLSGNELYDNAERQNKQKLEDYINLAIEKYRENNNVIGEIPYKIDKYESCMRRTKIETVEEKYLIPVSDD